ncbi:MAG: hypothetical protein L6V35_05695 [Alistipes putredinis]|nr:MAG: hypothetical protein L6V35_05695 [Alistipes putredinis]
MPEEPFGVELPDKIKARLSEIAVKDHLLLGGNTLKDIRMPQNTLVVMVHRGKDYFIPRGDTEAAQGRLPARHLGRRCGTARRGTDSGVGQILGGR